VTKKYNKIVDLNNVLHHLAQKYSLHELLASPAFQYLHQLFRQEVKIQISKRKCGWCNSKVKISKLSSEDKQVFYSSSLCPNCEDTYAKPINLH
jgi:hypothetical protein